MRTLRLILVCLTLALTLAPAADAFAAVSIVEKGMHHRVWETKTLLPDGTERIGTYTELASGLHYNDNGEWKETIEEFELFPDGAVARRGPHKAILSPNLNTLGAVDLLMPDGKPLKGHILGLSFYDPVSGRSALIAEVKDCQGELLPPNRILYRDAFTDVSADVVCTYTRAGFEVDVVFRAQLPMSPLDYGLAPAETYLEVVHEFIEAEQPQLDRQEPTIVTNAITGTKISSGIVNDRTIDFGAMRIAQGTAFPLGNNRPENEAAPIRVNKLWTTIDGRKLMFESVKFSDIQGRLEELPQAAAVPDADRKARRMATIERALPERRVAKAAMPAIIEVAKLEYKPKAYVLDYVILVTASNFTLRGDTTYFVTGSVNLTGSKLVIEGGTVVKFTNGYSGTINVFAPVICDTKEYRPAIFTAKDDNTVGEVIYQSTGVPSGVYGSNCLRLWNSHNYTLKHLRMSYAFRAIYCGNSRPNYTEVAHSQFLNCPQVFYLYGAEIYLRNVLINNVSDMIYNTYNGTGQCQANCENVTFHKINRFHYNAPTWHYLYNCLLVSVTNTPSYWGNNNASAADGASVFQTVGAAGHYLANGSAHRNAGTTNINYPLLVELRRRTTHPPVVVTADFTSNTTLAPVAQRDTDVPDLGYHYESLDYVWSDRSLTNAALVLTNGVCIGLYGEVGIRLREGATLISEGAPLALNRFVRYNSVQEQVNSNWAGGSSWITFKEELSSGSRPSATFRFTDFPLLANAYVYHYHGGDQIAKISYQDCSLYGGEWMQKYWSTAAWSVASTNSIWERVTLTLGTGSDPLVSAYGRNNLFRFGKLNLLATSTNSWAFHDNFLDNLAQVTQSNPITNSHNAYLSSSRLTPNSPQDVVLSAFLYTDGPLGKYYQLSTNLFNAGSRNATNAGLYHYTVKSSQERETNSWVDIGVHYAAASSEGVSSQGLVGHWRFDDGTGSTAADSSGLGHHGTLNYPFWTIGKVGTGALDFDGADDTVTVTDHTDLRPAHTTVTAWFFIESLSSAMTVATKPLNGPPWFAPYLSWLIRINSATSLEIDVGNGIFYSAWPISVPTFQVGRWYHVALTYDGTTLTAYLNGASIGTRGNVTGNLGYGSPPVLIGADYGASPAYDYFAGRIDDVRVYNRALSSAEISAFVWLTPAQLVDSDGDGAPDYFEDYNGDGSVNSGETSWLSYNSANGLTGAAALEVFTPLR